MSKKWKRILQRELDKEADQLMDLVNSDPKVRDAEAPQMMRDKLFARIDEKKAEDARLSEEEKELIRLGKVYKKKRKLNKILVLVAAVVATMAIGVTSFGGPEKIIQKVAGMMEGNEQINVNTNNGETDEVKSISEVEAYEQIEEEFGIYPVRMDYLPDGMEFENVVIADGTQCAYLFYGREDEASISYKIYPNYRTGSLGKDVEDKLLDEYSVDVEGNTLNVKKYLVEENQTQRWVVEYEYRDIYYVLSLYNLEEVENNEIIENLYFL